MRKTIKTFIGLIITLSMALGAVTFIYQTHQEGIDRVWGKAKDAAESAQSAKPNVDVNTDNPTLNMLRVVDDYKPNAEYDRIPQFGTPWTDSADTPFGGNGCDTNWDVMKRDMDDEVVNSDCSVERGSVNPDPYTGKKITYINGDGYGVDIEHVVALEDAWDSGADKLTKDERVALANDPDNLLAVDSGANRSKSSKSVDQWKPSNASFHCDYVNMQIKVKNRYNLSITTAEKREMSTILAAC